MSSKPKNIRVMREIARRWMKGSVLSASTYDSFQDTDLTDDEKEVIQDEVRRIAERITKEDAADNVLDLVNEYTER